MLKTIAEVSPVLLSFIDELDLPLSRPQKRHIAQVADALITTEGSKTLSALYRSIVGNPCPKAAADTFREAPWTAADLRVPLRAHLAEITGLENHLAGLLEQPLSMLLPMNADDIGDGLGGMLGGLQEFKESQGQPEDHEKLLGGFYPPQAAVGPAEPLFDVPVRNLAGPADMEVIQRAVRAQRRVGRAVVARPGVSAVPL